MGESDVVYFFVKQQKMDITQFDDVCMCNSECVWVLEV